MNDNRGDKFLLLIAWPPLVVALILTTKFYSEKYHDDVEGKAGLEELETAGQEEIKKYSNLSKLCYEISYPEDDEIIIEYLFPELRLDKDGLPCMSDMETDYTGYRLPFFAHVLALPRNTSIKDVKAEISGISYMDAKLKPEGYSVLAEVAGKTTVKEDPEGQYATFSEQDQFGWQLMYLQVHPVRYLADKEKLAYVERIKVTVSLEESQWEDVELDELELEYLDSMVDNMEILRKQKTR